jgi:hypothetical protein
MRRPLLAVRGVAGFMTADHTVETAAAVPVEIRHQMTVQIQRHCDRRVCAGVWRFKAGRGDPQRLLAMARVMKAGLPTWEELLIQPGEPWEPYVTPGARRGARAAIADAKACIPVV